MVLHINLVKTSDRLSPQHRDRFDFGTSIWHSLAIQTRLLAIFLLVFAIALTPMGKYGTWAIYAIAALCFLYWSKVDLKILGKRIALEFAFISVILLGTLFRGGGEILWQWRSLQVTTNGLSILASVSIKAFLSLLLLNILTLSTSIPELLKALITLKVSPLLVSIIASMYRYINVLNNEFYAMRRAATSRNFAPKNLWDRQRKDHAWQRQVLGNMLGMLFIRTYDRGDRIYQAMLARGYQGIPVVTESGSMVKRDRLALGCVMLIILIGQVIG
ncbi:cobalt ECF transporter T component CbiQ [Pseudanabaena sp. FACHB-1998]|nr:cobalt ECF transporter T component CbiQ [Pseudanabaena sp. FACHB-1998]